ncbi:helix-turn-helix domain-containing protein [Brevibacterium sp. 50QC2O2]|uniref:helix-turn-helix transcriptional regulator n=1 Tax=Brevibacterium sp. 50QC2O2 TaxID=2968459 RepID=UPI00211CFF47|nr:helix-turn-helix transcriptional regulator [Brevibacterium sp. 50QC2O2]MCQ9388489.1 helix-turn-helix domain-containing protein [Brevibacterium sp. 50QC2O2]
MSITLELDPSVSGIAPGTIGSALRMQRLQQGMSQAQLALRVGRSRKWVTDLERGIGSPGVDSVANAAHVLGLTLTLAPHRAIRTRAASLPGDLGRPNEDTWGGTETMAWVIDGATQPGDTVGTVSAAEYARTLSDAIQHYSAPGDSLEQVLAAAIRAAATWPRDEPGPAATVAMVRRRGTGYDWLVLGDAGFLVRNRAGSSQTVTDTRLASVAHAERTARQDARAAGAGAATLRRLSQALYRAELAARNTAGGYWVAADDPAAAEHALTGYTEDVDGIYLATDGVLDCIGAGSLWATPGAAAEAWGSMPPEEAIVRAQRHRMGDPAAKVDDATLLEVTEA